MQPFNLGYDNFLGRLAVGRIYEGAVKLNQTLTIKKLSGESYVGRMTKLFTFHGLERKEVAEAYAGDIVMAAGFPDIYIGETMCESADQEALPAISIDEPTISLNFLVNDSPFAGREGKFVTNQQIRERLEKELEINVGLRIDFGNDAYKVYGRGEMHVAILLENMRREGYEIQVSQPQVIIKDVDGVKSEPFEEAIVDVPTEMAGMVIERMGKRKGLMTEMRQGQGSTTRLVFDVPTRGLLGYRGQFTVDTKGEGILTSRMIGFRPHVGEIKKTELGSMVSMASGKVLAFSLNNLQDRGVLYIDPATEVYEGMVVGNVSKGNDMAVNPIKGKNLTNMRSSGADEAIKLIPAWTLSIERGLEIMAEDEYLEVTPTSVRLRKQYLTENDRVKAARKK
jgi:GTP-binding protein